MSSRKTRGRKTADKMAAYKVAASKNRQAPGTGSPPRNSSNERTPIRASLRSSPRTSANNSVRPSESRGSKRVILGHVSPRGSEIEPRTSGESSANSAGQDGRIDEAMLEKDQVAPNGGVGEPVLKKGNESGVTEFDPDEIIPETPERTPVARPRKRIVAPFRGKTPKAFSPENNGSEKPTKKRRLFGTPPKKNYQDEGDDMATEGGCDSLTAAADIGVLCSQEFDSPAHVDDELVTPPLGSTRIAPSSVLRRKKQTSVFIQKDRSLGEARCEPARRLMETTTDEGRHAERSAGASLFLDMMATSTTTLSRMFEGFTRKVAKDIDDMRRTHLDEIRKMGETLNKTMASEIRNIQGLFEMMSGAGKIGARGDHGLWYNFERLGEKARQFDTILHCDIWQGADFEDMEFQRTT